MQYVKCKLVLTFYSAGLRLKRPIHVNGADGGKKGNFWTSTWVKTSHAEYHVFYNNYIMNQVLLVTCHVLVWYPHFLIDQFR